MASFLKILAAIKKTEADDSLVSYLDFLASRLPIKEVYHQHVVKKISESSVAYDIFNQKISDLGSSSFDQECKSLVLKYKNIESIGFEVTAGRIIDELKNTKETCNYDIIALGKRKNGFSVIAKNVLRKIEANVLIVPEESAHTFTNILVPVDLSKHSDKLLANAIAIQEQSTEVVFITCLHTYEIPTIPAYKMLRTDAQIRIDTQERVKAAFDKFIEKHQTKKSNINPILIEEPNSWPSHYILEYINKYDIDFVLMGTQSHSFLDSLLGSTAEKVISNNDKCPMLIIK